jgi:hypothetical protein
MNAFNRPSASARSLFWLLIIALVLACPPCAPAAAPEPSGKEAAAADPLNRPTPRDAMAGFLRMALERCRRRTRLR